MAAIIMLPELLEELTAPLLSRIEDGPARERARLLLAELGRALRGAPPSPWQNEPAVLVASPDELARLEALVYEGLAPHLLPANQMRTLAGWFRAHAEDAWRQQAEARLQLISKVSTLG